MKSCHHHQTLPLSPSGTASTHFSFRRGLDMYHHPPDAYLPRNCALQGMDHLLGPTSKIYETRSCKSMNGCSPSLKLSIQLEKVGQTVQPSRMENTFGASKSRISALKLSSIQLYCFYNTGRHMMARIKIVTLNGHFSVHRICGTHPVTELAQPWLLYMNIV